MSIADLFKKVSKSFGDAKDPVCGMKVNLEQTQYKSTYQGKIYGFCSDECKKTFDQNPEQYAEATC